MDEGYDSDGEGNFINEEFSVSSFVSTYDENLVGPGEPRGVNLLDSCANRMVTSCPGDFLYYSGEECSTQGTGGKCSGKIGRLKQNNLGLEYGVLLQLPKGITRIIPWLGTGNLESRGFQLTLWPSDSITGIVQVIDRMFFVCFLWFKCRPSAEIRRPKFSVRARAPTAGQRKNTPKHLSL